jgi:predicted PurR-regulated permease PerM
MRWLTVALVAATGLVLWPYAPWLLLAIWIAALARGPCARLAQRLGGRTRLAAALTMIALAALVAPAVVLVASLAGDARALVDRALASHRVQDVLRRLAEGDGAHERSLSELVGLAQKLAGTAAQIVIGVVILGAGMHAILVDGARWYGWLERHAPIPPADLGRLAGAFVETGRGLFVGIVGAGLAQAIVATIAYVVLDVPRPLALGLLTLAFSVVPAIGTAIVWLPVAVGLAITDRPSAAVALVIAGVALIGTVDNLVRPYLARRGRLQLPTYVVLVSMFGGVALLGARGLIIGPLVVRLAKAALEAPDASHTRWRPRPRGHRARRGWRAPIGPRGRGRAARGGARRGSSRRPGRG